MWRCPVLEAQSGLEASYDAATAAIEENGQTLDITTAAGRDNENALLDVAKAGWDLIDSMEANGSTQDELQSTMAGTRERFLEVAAQMGLSTDAAAALADQLGLIPSNITTDVSVDVGNAQAAINSFILSNTGKRIRIGVDTFGGHDLPGLTWWPRAVRDGRGGARRRHSHIGLDPGAPLERRVRHQGVRCPAVRAALLRQPERSAVRQWRPCGR